MSSEKAMLAAEYAEREEFREAAAPFRTEVVLGLLRKWADEGYMPFGDFSLAVLADALEELGFPHSEVLTRLRSPYGFEVGRVWESALFVAVAEGIEPPKE